MKTTEDIERMYINNLMKKDVRDVEEMTEEQKIEKAKRPHSVNITDICVYKTMCPRLLFYNKIVKRPIPYQTKIRFSIGNLLHDTPINESGNEISFNYEGIRCRMDDLDMEEGWIADKKTVAFMPIKVKEYPEVQLNLYRVIAEENNERPFKVNQLFVLNINTTSCDVKALEVPMWEKEKAKQYLFDAREEILTALNTLNLPCKKKSWWCETCPYTDLCEKESVSDVPIEPRQTQPEKKIENEFVMNNPTKKKHVINVN